FQQVKSNIRQHLFNDMIRKALVILASGTLALSASAQTTLAVTSSVVTVSDRKYTVYDYADPAAKKFCVVIPEALKTVRGLLVECNYAGGDSRGDWTFCTYLPVLSIDYSIGTKKGPD